MGNIVSSDEFNYKSIRLMQLNYLYRHVYNIEIQKLDEKTLVNMELKINKLNYKYINNPEVIVKIIKTLHYYVNNESQYTLGQIDAFNFTVNGRLKFQLINVNSKHNQSLGGVNTEYYYYKVCELTEL
jgi:hypothetical protein